MDSVKSCRSGTPTRIGPKDMNLNNGNEDITKAERIWTGTSKDKETGNICEGCNREFKNSRGVKIHQGKTKYGKLISNRSQRKSEDIVCTQEKTHSDADIHEKRKDIEIVPSPPPSRVSVSSVIKEETRGSLKQPSVRDWMKVAEATDTQSKQDRNEDRQERKEVSPSVTRVFTETGRRSTVDKKATKAQKSIREWIMSTSKSSPGSQGKEPGRKLEEQHTRKTPPQENNLTAQQTVEDGVLRLSSAEISNMKRNILLGRKDEVLARHNLQIKRQDLRSLYNQNYLNDTIVDEYFLKIQNRRRKTEDPSVAVLTIYFYQRFDRLNFTEAYTQTESWIHEDLRLKDMILIPIHKSSHFTLIHIDTKKKIVSYLDPLEGSRYSSEAPGRMKRFIEEYFRRKGEPVSFKVKIRDNIPTQTNGVDCGVFISHYAERISRNAELRFSQANMQSFRTKMMWEILHGELKQVMLLPSREMVSPSSSRCPQSRQVQPGPASRWDPPGTPRQVQPGPASRRDPPGTPN